MVQAAEDGSQTPTHIHIGSLSQEQQLVIGHKEKGPLGQAGVPKQFKENCWPG